MVLRPYQDRELERIAAFAHEERAALRFASQQEQATEFGDDQLWRCSRCFATLGPSKVPPRDHRCWTVPDYVPQAEG